MDRRGKIDALFRSVGTIEDPDAFRYVIEREPDDYVLADLRDRFWDGQGENHGGCERLIVKSSAVRKAQP